MGVGKRVGYIYPHMTLTLTETVFDISARNPHTNEYAFHKQTNKKLKSYNFLQDITME